MSSAASTSCLLPTDAILAINNAGQVAYEAWYADTEEMGRRLDSSGRGIFVDDHLASNTMFDAHGNAFPFVFTDDSRIVVENPHVRRSRPRRTPLPASVSSFPGSPLPSRRA